MKRYIHASTSNSINPFKNRTGISYYDEFLNPDGLEYMRSRKNRDGEVIQMTPSEYFYECAHKVFDTSVEELKRQRGLDNLVDTYAQNMIDGDKFPLPYINYADHGQEGLHRMMAAGQAFGWDVEFPVLIVTSLDVRKDELNNIWRYWSDAIHNAEQYTYYEGTWKTDVVEQVQSKLNELTDSYKYHVLQVSDNDDSVSITIKEFQDMMKSSIIYKPKTRDTEEVDWDAVLDDDLLDDDDLLLDDDIDSILKEIQNRRK